MLNSRQSTQKRQTGSALIIGLTVLLLMLILGTAGDANHDYGRKNGG